jgi:hypothetical protein
MQRTTRFFFIYLFALVAVLTASEEVASVSVDFINEVGFTITAGAEEVIGLDVRGARSDVGDLEGEVVEEGAVQLSALTNSDGNDDVAGAALVIATTIHGDGVAGLLVLEELEGITEDVLAANVELTGTRFDHGGGFALASVETIEVSGFSEALLLLSGRLAAEDFTVVEEADVVVADTGLEFHDGFATCAVSVVAALELDEAAVTS